MSSGFIWYFMCVFYVCYVWKYGLSDLGKNNFTASVLCVLAVVSQNSHLLLFPLFMLGGVHTSGVATLIVLCAQIVNKV